MTPQQELKCLIIIQNAAAAAGLMGAGLAQLPTLDRQPVASVLSTMAQAIGQVFDRPVSNDQARAAVDAYVSARPLRGTSQWVVGWVPVFGNALNGVTAASLAHGIGWAVARALDTGEALPGVKAA